jgi:hypothetical protein
VLVPPSSDDRCSDRTIAWRRTTRTSVGRRAGTFGGVPWTRDELGPLTLELLDNAFDPLLERTAGMTDDEYLWEPVDGCWTVRRRDGGWQVDHVRPEPVPPPVTTIAWRSWHIAVDCLDSYSSGRFGTRGTGLEGTEWVGTWVEARAMLEQAWAVFRAGVASWGEDGLFEKLGPAWGPYAEHNQLELAMHAQHELIHHGAEIALLRDLYARRR